METILSENTKKQDKHSSLLMVSRACQNMHCYPFCLDLLVSDQNRFGESPTILQLQDNAQWDNKRKESFNRVPAPLDSDFKEKAGKACLTFLQFYILLILECP